jgi:type I restriction enzyme M protein
LILDKRLAKKSQHILFLKIENDGFDLGAQRREIDKNDLPSALQTLEAFKECLSNDKALEDLPSLATMVDRTTILNNKDFGLSAERYFEKGVSQTEFEIVKIEDVAEVISGQSPESSNYNDNGEGLPFYQGRTDFGQIYLEAPTKWTTQITKEAYKNDILMSVRAPVGPVNIATEKICIGRGLAAIRPKENIEQFYLFYMLRSLNGIIKGNGGAVFDSISRDQIKEIEIPLPPLEIQQQIVAEIEGYQKIIDGAKQVVNNYKPAISINPDWEMATLDQLCDFIDYRGKTPTKTESGVRLITAKNVRKGYIDIEPQEFIGLDDYDNVMTRGIPKKGDVLFTTEAPLGNVALLDLDERISLAQRIILLRPKHKSLLSRFLVQALLDSNTQNRIENYASGSTVLGIKQSSLREIEIPVPPIEQQELIVKAIEEEKQLVNSNKRLIEIFEQKIKTKIGEVWGLRGNV